MKSKASNKESQLKVWFFLFFSIFASTALANEVKLPKQTYVPVFRDPGELDTQVGPLWVDETAVTNAQFLVFLKADSRWRKSKIPALYADPTYLSHWISDTEFRKSEADFPVTHVSWFVARKYCGSLGKRLPTIAEWEVASDSQNPKSESQILRWYEKPDSNLKAVGKEASNKFGIKDAHGMIWEWVENYSETMMSGDSRGGSSMEALYCGGAALKAKDPRLYATFLRFAFRSSLKASYDSANLGFRCVRDALPGGL